MNKEVINSAHKISSVKQIALEGGYHKLIFGALRILVVYQYNEMSIRFTMLTK